MSLVRIAWLPWGRATLARETNKSSHDLFRQSRQKPPIDLLMRFFFDIALQDRI
jgi:hypothetical protein